MAMRPALRPASDHLHPMGETCPYCEQSIPNDRAEEIRARYQVKQHQQEAALKARAEQQLAEIRSQFEAAKQAEVAQLKADALAQQSAAREEGKNLAIAEAQQRIAAIVAEQEVARRKADEADKVRAAAVAELEAVKAKQQATLEAALAVRTAEVRTAMEKNKTDDLSSLSAKHAEEMRKVAEQMKSLHRRLAEVEGEEADLKLIDVLKDRFKKDDIRQVRKSSGADIVHTVYHNKKECGVIIYDSRNRNAWNPKFASELRGEMVPAKAKHAILTSGKFPGGQRQICIYDGVIVASPAHVVVLASILREEMVRSFAQRVGAQDQERKTAKLYDFIASDRFDNVLESLAANDEKLLQLDEDEKLDHEKTWKKRRQLTTNSQKLHGTLRSDIDRIIGTETD